MRAAIFRDGDLVADEMPEPNPETGQVLVKTLACGICGSDLHAFHHADKMVEQARRSGSAFGMDTKKDIVFGHEFCAEVLEHGPGTEKKLKPGTRVCSMPLAITMNGGKAKVHPVGYSNEKPGGFAEQMVLNELILLEVPNGLPTEQAALRQAFRQAFRRAFRQAVRFR